MTISTVSDINGFFADLYEQAMFNARENNLMSGLVTNLSASGMQTRYQGIYPTLTAQKVAEGVDYSNAQLWNKSAKMEIVPQISKTQTIVTKARMMTDPDDTMNDAAQELGGAISTDIDTDLLDLFSSFSTDKGTAGSALTIARCSAAMAVLTNNKARPPYYFMIHPFHWHSIWLELGQPATNKALLGDVANAALMDYYKGDWMGATWFASANIAIDSSTDAVGAIFNREALALDTRQAPQMTVEEDASIAGFGYEINVEAWYGVGVRRGEYGVKLTADATEPTGV